jgi:hypothetical protein
MSKPLLGVYTLETHGKTWWRQNQMAFDTSDIGDDLKISEITPRKSAGGTWVTGSLNGHRFEALVFEDHANVPENEMGISRIAKFWLRRESDQKEVCHFDRGWDLEPETEEATAIANFLAAGLAEVVEAERRNTDL